MRNQSSIGTLLRLQSWRRQNNSIPTRNSQLTTSRSRPSSLHPLYSGIRHSSSQSPPSSRSKLAAVAQKDADAAESKQKRKQPPKLLTDDGLTLSHFIKVTQTDNAATSGFESSNYNNDAHSDNDLYSAPPMPADLGDEFDDQQDFMVTDAMSSSNKDDTTALDRLGHQMIHCDDGSNQDTEDSGTFHTLKFHLKTYGCQMNVNDTDIVRSILLNNHIISPNNDDEIATSNTAATSVDSTTTTLPTIKFAETTDEIQADVLLTNTCAIRENAEQKVWNRLRNLRSHDRNFPLSSMENVSSEDFAEMTPRQKKQLRYNRQSKSEQKQQQKKRIVGVLGCMAERLKEDMFKDGTADVVVGPDAYRDLPRLVSVLAAPSVNHIGNSSNEKNSAGAIPTERAVNVQLSLDETYASITPVRSNPNDVSAFVSIMRGCNNMCSYCVVPFTRGRERSRDMESIVEETRRLLDEENIKEVILLGQNVNSYHDVMRGEKKRHDGDSTYQTSNDGFSNMFRLRHGDGNRFADLLEAVSSLSPELRVRFTSPHPKDYPPDLLSLMAERANICNHLHMPAQSGSSSVLQRMRRGYTREAYLELIDDVRGLIPDVAISSDFIAGFCGETDEEHKDTITMMEKVQFDQAFMFAYSMRGKTHAHRTMEDDVPADVKNRRLNEVIDCFRHNVQLRNDATEVGKLRLVLVEGESKRSTTLHPQLSGRTDENKRVVFGNGDLLTEDEVNPFLSHAFSSRILNKGGRVEPFAFQNLVNETNMLKNRVDLNRGDYVVVQITESRGHTLKGQALWRSSIVGFDHLMNMQGWKDTSSGLVVSNFMQSSLV